MEMVTREDITAGLRELGLRTGDIVVAHSSLSSFGKVEGGEETVVDAIFDVIGPEGTLVAPTFNYKPGIFDPNATESMCGRVTEAVRLRPNAVRSLHPTHSVAAVGALAHAVTEGHEKTHSFGRGSALFKVLQANGKVLLLGVDHTSNSMIHVAEEIAGAPYLDRSLAVDIRISQEKIRRTWVRRPGCSAGFNAIREPLEEQGAISKTTVGSCTAMLMSARAVVNTAVEMLKSDPESLLCERPECPACAEARAMVAATEAERQDKEITELAEEEERTRRYIETRMNAGEVKFFEPDRNDTSPN
jgi:aminoglycoside 3-N-acetyltransferase